MFDAHVTGNWPKAGKGTYLRFLNQAGDQRTSAAARAASTETGLRDRAILRNSPSASGLRVSEAVNLKLRHRYRCRHPHVHRKKAVKHGVFRSGQAYRVAENLSDLRRKQREYRDQ